jgi:hypothetical protein
VGTGHRRHGLEQLRYLSLAEYGKFGGCSASLVPKEPKQTNVIPSADSLLHRITPSKMKT